MRKISKKNAIKMANRGHKSVVSAMGSTIENAIANGEIFLEIKKRANFNFGEMFDDENCHVTQIQAGKYMRIAIHKNQARLEFKEGTASTINQMQKCLPRASESPMIEEQPLLTEETKEKKPKRKSRIKSNFERLSDHCMSFTEGIQFWADKTINPETDDDAIEAATVLDSAPNIILQFLRLGVDVERIIETAKGKELDYGRRSREASSEIIDVTPDQ